MDISIIYMGHPEFFVFIDETGSDGRDRQRKFGYSIGGRPAVCSNLLFRGQRISAIAAISYDNGLLDGYSVTGTVDGDVFSKFLTDS